MATTAPASASPSSPATGSIAGDPLGDAAPLDRVDQTHLAAPLAGVDPGSWSPSDPGEAQGAIASVAAFCADYCPVSHACVEEACQLYRLEQRASDYLEGPAEPGPISGQQIIGLGI